MLYGHIGVALAAKPIEPKTPTSALLIATSLIDFLCGIFVISGIEWVKPDGTSSMPWSHGLFMGVVWMLATYGVTWLISKNRKMSLILALLVFSHWVLDFISHPMGMGQDFPKDIPLLFENSPKVGLGLYNSAIVAFVTDIGLLAIGSVIFLVKSKTKNRSGRWAFVVLILYMAIFPLSLLLPEKLSIATTFLPLGYIPLGYWLDKNRTYQKWK
ncbi:MAG: hypothetical protein JW798_17495 [Prolixibacteraceae bacterium]|nr:hypothetical protein [Prolixibacteraceae bacterium]